MSLWIYRTRPPEQEISGVQCKPKPEVSVSKSRSNV